jgi:hypothetical protein
MVCALCRIQINGHFARELRISTPYYPKQHDVNALEHYDHP